jgi:hypothetical protein
MNRVLVGGKTGTAELTGTNENGTWFVSFGGPAGQKPQFVTVIEVDRANQGAVNAAPYARNMWDQIYGFGGNKALFPNGVPPKSLPNIQIVEAGLPPAQHHKRPTSASSSASPTATQSALGPPPALIARHERRGALR